MLEFEKKIMLSAEEYRFLKKGRYAAGKTKVQVNSYYDTDDFELSRQGITCRIREKDGICMATVKEHRIKGSDCSVENSRRVKNRHDDSLFRDMNIFFQGKLKTVRSTYSPKSGILVMLDRNSYLGTVDYELEIEYDQGYEYLADAEIEEIISEMTENRILNDPIEFKNRTGHGENKASRFFSRKAELSAETGRCKS